MKAIITISLCLLFSLNTFSENVNSKKSKNLKKTVKEHKASKKAHSYITSVEWQTITKRTYELETKRLGTTKGYKLGKRYSKTCKKYVDQYYKAIIVVH